MWSPSFLEGKPRDGVGPQDVALAIIRAVFKNGFVQNKVMEFVGPGIGNLSVDFRNGIDVMTTETTCLSTIWRTDEKSGGLLPHAWPGRRIPETRTGERGLLRRPDPVDLSGWSR